jgi:hypothetical protein
MERQETIQLNYGPRQPKPSTFSWTTFALLVLLMAIIGYVLITSIGGKVVFSGGHSGLNGSM